MNRPAPVPHSRPGVNKPAETGLMDTGAAGGRGQQSIHLIAILHHRINASTTHTHIYTIYFYFHAQIEKKMNIQKNVDIVDIMTIGVFFCQFSGNCLRYHEDHLGMRLV